MDARDEAQDNTHTPILQVDNIPIENLRISSGIEIKKQDESDILRCFQNLLAKVGYTQLIHKPVDEKDPILSNPNVKPKTADGQEASGIVTNQHIMMLTSSRLFVKDNNFYVLLLRGAFNVFKSLVNDTNTSLEELEQNLKSKNSLKEFPNGVCIAVVALIKNQEGVLEKQLRIIPNVTSGHPNLVLKTEGKCPPCLIAAGEIYFKNGKIILINDKSGYFHQFLDEQKIDQAAVFDSMLADYYAPEYKMNCFFKATGDDAAIVKEVLKREFPYSLLPQDIRGAFPLTFFDVEFRGFVETIDNKYKSQISDSSSVSANNKAAWLQKPFFQVPLPTQELKKNQVDSNIPKNLVEHKK